jgi:hypothetical protein
MSQLSPEAIEILEASAVRYDMLMLAKSEGTWIRLWTGAGDFVATADAVDTTGGRYLGLGILSGVPALNQLINGVAERLEFTMSGIDELTLNLADAEAATVRRADTYIGMQLFDDDYQRVDGIYWLWHGKADTPKTASEMSEDGIEIRTMTLSVGSPFVIRRRPGLSYFNGIDQRAISPTDAICDRVTLYTQETTIRWP